MSDLPRISYSTHCSNIWEPAEVGGSFLWLHKSWIKLFLCCKQTWIQIHSWLWPIWVKSPTKEKLSVAADWDLSKRWYRGMGKVERNMFWEKLAEMELEDGPGLLKVGGCNFCWINSHFLAFLLAHPWVQPPLHLVTVGKDGADVHLLPVRVPVCTSSFGPCATAFLAILFKQKDNLIASFKPVAGDEVYTFLLCSSVFFLSNSQISVAAETFSVAGPAKKETPNAVLPLHRTDFTEITQTWLHCNAIQTSFHICLVAM